MSKMTNCKACGEEIAKGVKKCPHCGKDQRNFFMKHKILSGLVIIILLVIIGSSTANKPTKVGTTGSKPTSGTASDTSPAKTQTFSVGDIVKLDDYKVTVNKVYVVKGNEYAKPESGNEFLAADITVENISNSEQSISSIMMFKIVNKDGRAYDESLTGLTAAKAGQMDGTIGVGRKMTGVYVVEVPKGTKGLELEFDGSLLTTGQVIVKLN